MQYVLVMVLATAHDYKGFTTRAEYGIHSRSNHDLTFILNTLYIKLAEPEQYGLK